MIRSCVLSLLLFSAVATAQQDASAPKQGATPPAVVENPAPDFKSCGKAALDHPAIVLLKMTVTVDGTAADVAVTQGSGNDCLDQRATEAVERYRFKPAMRDGVAIATAAVIRVNIERRSNTP
jgi:protein TonB